MTRTHQPLLSVPALGLVFSWALLGACSTGGDEDRPTSEIRVTASHHMFALGGQKAFGAFPVPKTRLSTDRAVLNLAEAGTYSITRSSGNSSPVAYAIDEDGSFALLVPIANKAPTRYLGAYQQSAAGDLTQVFFFTDRYAPKEAETVGLFWGTRTAAGTPDPKGTWHLFSQSVVFANSVVLDPDSVGRAASGKITIAADPTPNQPDVITGTGAASTGANLTFTGTAAAFDDGKLTLGIDFAAGSADPRSYQASQSKDVILGVDENDTDGKIGLIGMVRAFDAPTTKAELAKFAGTYDFGMSTIFVNPGASGLDAANGNIRFNDQGGWVLEGVGVKDSQAAPFDYAGSFTLADDGLVTMIVNGSNQTWKAAIDPSYQVLVLVDAQIEGGAAPELNIALGVRRPEPK